MELKSVVVAKEGVANIGKHVIGLEDKTQSRFETHSLDQFVSYAATLENDGSLNIFYNDKDLAIHYKKPRFNMAALAYCTLNPDPMTTRVINLTKQTMTLEVLDERLYELRNIFEGTEGMQLYGKLQKFNVKKVTSFSRERDNQGNYAYHYERKDDTAGGELPASISFLVKPFIMSERATLKVSLDLFVSFSDSADKGPTIGFSFKNPTLEEDIKEASREVIETRLEECNIPSYEGSLHVIENTDRWRYLLNGIE